MSVPEHVIDDELNKPSYFQQRSIYDWVWAVVLMAGTFYAWNKYNSFMDSYEVGILFGSALSLIAIGWGWRPMRNLVVAVAALSLLGVSLYGAYQSGVDFQVMREEKFLLKFLISGEAATMWMSALFVMATVTYFIQLFSGNDFVGKVASAMVWSASTMGLVGLMVRWRESYLIHIDVGHIPVSNLYEVFILFAIITALIYLYYEAKYQTKSMGAFAMLVISASIGFLLWYHFAKGADEIKPLVPALQSYWMKIHVPANFVGYGAFGLAAMLGVFYIFIEHAREAKLSNQVLGTLVVFLVSLTTFWVKIGVDTFSNVMMVAGATVLTTAVFWGIGLGIVRSFQRLGETRLPDLSMLDDVMHKSIALGFAFFTIATVLGAMWAAEAWGGYWSWDPKETWALIVWLNYAAWLHLRLTKGWRGRPLAWWAVIGLFVTTFAFLGVNMVLSGLHSYGEL